MYFLFYINFLTFFTLFVCTSADWNVHNYQSNIYIYGVNVSQNQSI